VTDLPPPDSLTAEDAADLVHEATKGGDSAGDTADGLHRAIEAIRPIPERGDDIALVVLRIAPANSAL
jgi:hypothetical protein